MYVTDMKISKSIDEVVIQITHRSSFMKIISSRGMNIDYSTDVPLTKSPATVEHCRTVDFAHRAHPLSDCEPKRVPGKHVPTYL